MIFQSKTIKPLTQWGLWVTIPSIMLWGATTLLSPPRSAKAQVEGGRAITVRSDIQEANQNTGVITARGNVRINYPARQMEATATQAQYFSQERQIVLTGNVYVIQEGNTIRGETVTYLIDEARFIAMPEQNRQVESVYIIEDPDAPASTTTAPPPQPYNPKPAFKGAYSTSGQ